LDSGVKHAVSGSAYTRVRVAAFMGYTIIAATLGTSPEQIAAARRTGAKENLPFGGYLANISPSEFEEKFAAVLPNNISGKAFKAQFGFTIDPVTEIEDEEIYAVRSCTAHPIYENDRVKEFQSLLQSLTEAALAQTQALLQKAGALMYASHQSYSACGLGNEHTDELVEMVRSTGPEKGVFGAKITGGGSGGTVCILAFDTLGINTVQQIRERYAQKYQQGIVLFNGSSPGGFYS
ncbi:MAG: GHMP kinase, partial [Cytophagales bacterium CG18_big_fil_WC_8_21_14_2_50_42_9]